MNLSTDDIPDEYLRDEALRRALAHAPDHTAAPDWRIRKAILQSAHDAVAGATAATPAAQARPWWKLFGSQGGGGARMPWNAAFATVLVATLVVVLWQREQLPGAALDGEARVGVPASNEAVPPSTVTPPVATDRPPRAAPGGANQVKAPSDAARAPATSTSPIVPRPAPPAPADDEAARKSIEAAAAARARMEERAKAAYELPPLPPPPPPPTGPAPAPSQGQLSAAAPPAAPAAPGALGSRGEASAFARAAPSIAPPAAPLARTDSTEPPSFSALSQWNRVTIARPGGPSRSLTRADAPTLGGLLGSAAITAIDAQALGAAPDWRVTFERDGKVLAVLEIAQGRVRWREGQTPAATGTPSVPALAALRNALQTAIRPPAEPEAAPVPLPVAPTAPQPEPDGLPRPAEPGPPPEPPSNP